MLLQMTLFQSSLWLNDIPLCVCVCVYKASDTEKKMESKEFCTKTSHSLFSDKVLLRLLLQHRGVRPKKFPLLALSLTGKKVCSLYEVRVGL